MTLLRNLILPIVLAFAWTGTVAAAEPPANLVEAVRGALVQEIASHSPWNASQIVVPTIALPNGFTVPQGARFSVMVPEGKRLFGQVPFQIALIRGEERTTAWAVARVDIMVDVAVATRVINRHELLSENMVTLQPRSLATLSGGEVTDLSTVMGLQAMQRISPGGAISRRMVEVPPLVHRGSRVMLRVVRPGMEVTAQGEARQDGAPGETIEVLNATSRRTIQGRVIDANTVEVGF